MQVLIYKWTLPALAHMGVIAAIAYRLHKVVSKSHGYKSIRVVAATPYELYKEAFRVTFQYAGQKTK